MENVIEKIKNIVRVEQTEKGVYSVDMPVIYEGGDWINLTITENPGGTFNITDAGNAISNAQAFMDNLVELNIHRYVSKITKQYDVLATQEAVIYLKTINSEQLYSAMIDVAKASQKLSNTLIEQSLQQESKKIHDLVENKLKVIFRNQFKKKVILDYVVIGNSSRQYSIPFCIDNAQKRFIEPTANNANSIAATHLMFFDIGKSSKFVREVVIDDFKNWESPNIEILKPVCDRIIPYEQIAA